MMKYGAKMKGWLFIGVNGWMLVCGWCGCVSKELFFLLVAVLTEIESKVLIWE